MAEGADITPERKRNPCSIQRRKGPMTLESKIVLLRGDPEEHDQAIVFSHVDTAIGLIDS